MLAYLTVGLFVCIVNVPHHLRAGGRNLLAEFEVLIDRIAIQGVQRHGRTTLEFREHGGGRHRTQPPSQSALRLRRSGGCDGGDDAALAAAGRSPGGARVEERRTASRRMGWLMFAVPLRMLATNPVRLMAPATTS